MSVFVTIYPSDYDADTNTAEDFRAVIEDDNGALENLYVDDPMNAIATAVSLAEMAAFGVGGVTIEQERMSLFDAANDTASAAFKLDNENLARDVRGFLLMGEDYYSQDVDNTFPSDWQ